jgi:hypothetical protein
LPVILVLALAAGCAATGPPPEAAIRAAQASYVTYETLAPIAAQATMDLLKIQRTRPLTDAEQGRLNGLKKLGKVLEDFRLAHRIYIQTLSPVDRGFLVDLLNRSIDLGLSLGLNFNAVRLP